MERSCKDDEMDPHKLSPSSPTVTKTITTYKKIATGMPEFIMALTSGVVLFLLP